MTKDADQLGFEALLKEADHDNAARAFTNDTAHLPDSMADSIPLHREQIAAHHAAMLACDFEAAQTIREEAHLLARKLNKGAPGILASDDAPGCVLARDCAATLGTVPLWGQDGEFEITVHGCAIQITMHGMFGIASYATYLGFEARAVNPAAPFISQTGYRSFLGCHVPPEPEMTTGRFASRVIAHHIETELKGSLVRIAPEYR